MDTITYEEFRDYLIDLSYHMDINGEDFLQRMDFHSLQNLYLPFHEDIIEENLVDEVETEQSCDDFQVVEEKDYS